MRSKRSLEGEILIDHRASPGLSPEVAQWMGVEPAAVRKGELYESPIITCAHCQATVVLKPERVRARGWCGKCDKYICDDCVARLHLTLTCRTVAKRVDEAIDAIAHGVSPLLIPQL